MMCKYKNATALLLSSSCLETSVTILELRPARDCNPEIRTLASSHARMFSLIALVASSCRIGRLHNNCPNGLCTFFRLAGNMQIAASVAPGSESFGVDAVCVLLPQDVLAVFSFFKLDHYILPRNAAAFPFAHHLKTQVWVHQRIDRVIVKVLLFPIVLTGAWTPFSRITPFAKANL